MPPTPPSAASSFAVSVSPPLDPQTVPILFTPPCAPTRLIVTDTPHRSPAAARHDSSPGAHAAAAPPTPPSPAVPAAPTFDEPSESPAQSPPAAAAAPGHLRDTRDTSPAPTISSSAPLPTTIVFDRCGTEPSMIPVFVKGGAGRAAMDAGRLRVAEAASMTRVCKLDESLLPSLLPPPSPPVPTLLRVNGAPASSLSKVLSANAGGAHRASRVP